MKFTLELLDVYPKILSMNYVNYDFNTLLVIESGDTFIILFSIAICFIAYLTTISSSTGSAIGGAPRVATTNNNISIPLICGYFVVGGMLYTHHEQLCLCFHMLNTHLVLLHNLVGSMYELFGLPNKVLVIELSNNSETFIRCYHIRSIVTILNNINLYIMCEETLTVIRDMATLHGILLAHASVNTNIMHMHYVFGMCLAYNTFPIKHHNTYGTFLVLMHDKPGYNMNHINLINDKITPIRYDRNRRCYVLGTTQAREQANILLSKVLSF